MIRLSFIVLVAITLVSCASQEIPLRARQLDALAPLKFADQATEFQGFTSVRISPSLRRPFVFRHRLRQLGVSDGFDMDLSFRGSIDLSAKSDGRVASSVVVNSIDGTIAVGRGQTLTVLEGGFSQVLFESVHDFDNSFLEIGFPLLHEVNDANNSNSSQRSDATRLTLLKIISENNWPLHPINKSEFAVGDSVGPSSQQEFRRMLTKELIPAAFRSPRFRDWFERSPYRRDRGAVDSAEIYKAIEPELIKIFGGDSTLFGDKILGYREWSGRRVLESVGPIKISLSMGTQLDSVAINLDGNIHSIIDPMSGLRLRTEFVAIGRGSAADGRSIEVLQQLSVTIAAQ
jgi:hypothetical protein